MTEVKIQDHLIKLKRGLAQKDRKNFGFKFSFWIDFEIGYWECAKMEEENEMENVGEVRVVWTNSDGRHSGSVGNFSSQNN